MRVLVVEDNADLAANLLDYLEVMECTADYAANGQEALALLSRQQFDVIVLDVMMPGPDGFSVCRTIRESYIDTPVLFLTARDTLDDKTEGFEAGGDDYLVKPFSMQELWLRLQALTKRNMTQRGNLLQVADLTLDLNTMVVSRAGQLIKLNRSCMTILQCLMQHSPKVVSRATLEHELWGDDMPDTDVLRSHLYNLRSRLDKPFDHQLLHTVHGQGFCLRGDEPDV